MYEFRWNDWNIDKCYKHGVEPNEAEHVVQRARAPFPSRIEDEKLVVWGQTEAGRYLQVIYLIDPEGTAFIIHAMPLSEKQKFQLRRRRR